MIVLFLFMFYEQNLLQIIHFFQNRQLFTEIVYIGLNYMKENVEITMVNELQTK